MARLGPLVGIPVLLLGVGAVALVGGITFNHGTMPVPDTPTSSPHFLTVCGLGDCVAPQGEFGGTITFSWSHATNQTTVSAFDYPRACSSGNGTGASAVASSGSITFPMAAGHCYGVFENGTPEISVSYQIYSLSYAELAGTIMIGSGAIIGAVMVVVVLRRRTRLKGEGTARRLS